MNHSPSVVHTRTALREALNDLPGKRGLVMTMGALHEGHLSLVTEARKHCDHVVVTVFVNPTQFAPGEDFDAYPRTLDADVAALTRAHADLVFAPSVEDVYPHGDAQVTINPGPTAQVLEGATRPTHFAGVCLVVHKVFNLIRPDVAVFGQKDAQQLAIIRQMVRDLDMGIEIVGAPIVRAEDGLALSSRNAYLSATERTQALVLSRALQAGQRAASSGKNAETIVRSAREVLASEPAADVDYVALVDPTTFLPVSRGEAVLALAAKIGTTRLIDNTVLEVNDD
ncbi:MAG: pantoate--beta-alanine ligase [Actinomycetaceae bacterium]|nr:pantoate--beta-alanine ligase [Actinomycetaceae bacterium]